MRKELLAPLAMLALGLAAAGGFFAASAALSEGGGQKASGARIVVQEPEESARPSAPGLLRRAYAGVVLAEIPNGEGVRIDQVVPGSPADHAGLESGDIITAVDGQSVQSVGSVQEAVTDKSPGDQVTFRVRRDDHEEDVDVTLGTRADAIPMPQVPRNQVPPAKRSGPTWE